MDPMGRYIFMNILKFSTKNFICCNSLNEILQQRGVRSNNSLITGGDFNITMNSEIDKKGGILNKKSKSVHVLQSLLYTYELQDIW